MHPFRASDAHNDEPADRRSTLRRRVGAVGALVSAHATAVSLTLIVLFATVTRTWQLSAVGFSGDEAVYAGQSALLAHVPGMGRWFVPASRGNSNFLATQWVISLVYRVFGVSEVGARLVSVVASVLTVVLVFLIARELRYRRSEALFAALVLGVSGYATVLGRLALLDAAACFAVTLAMLFLARWHRTDRYLWLVLFVVATALAMQVKVTSVIVVPIALAFLLLTRRWPRLSPGRVLALLVIGVAALTPAFVQLATDSGGLLGYFGSSLQRTSVVPWYYYLGLLWRDEGVLLCLVLAVGVAIALVRHEPRDMLPLIWLIGVAAFVQLYPLKGFNYLLPAVPALALLAGRALGLAVQRIPRTVRSRRIAVLPLVAAVVVASQLGPVGAAVGNDRSAGMREAARWLQARGAERAGALVLSHGSGQYVLSFDGGIDSYPYGRFRIATVIPGGRVVKTTARSGGAVPLDWVAYWPARLIAQGRVSYLVYQTRPLDDPPEQSQVAGTVTEKQFRSLIALYGGRLVHRVYWHHEARVYIYRVARRLPRPIVKASPLAVPSSGTAAKTGVFAVKADGFAFNSPLTATYHGHVVAHGVSNGVGHADLRVAVPVTGQWQYHLVVSDKEGNHASTTGVARTKLSWKMADGFVRVSGSGFEPRGTVAVSYREKPVGVTHARPDGTISLPFRLPANTHPRFRIVATGDGGRTAYATGLPTPSLAFTSSHRIVRLTGRHFSASSPVSIALGGRIVGVARAGKSGTFRYRVHLPKSAVHASRLSATDTVGRRASVIGLVHR